MTVVFNAFVWLQIFNFIACRRINDEINIFEGIHKNCMFVGIWTFTAVLQLLIVFFGGYAGIHLFIS